MAKGKEIWVSKFGGTSLANASQIAKVKDIVFADDRRKLVVVSAPGKEHKEDTKVTDLLLTCHKLVEQGKSYDEPFAIIRRRINEIASALGVGLDMDKELDDIYARLSQEKTADFAGSRGEYLNALMISEFFGATFVDAGQIIRLTEDGRVDDETYEIAEKVLKTIEGRIVLPGFYGTGPHGGIQTFSRGGSDITGAIAARSIGADIYENWTDVSGIYIADPRVAEKAGPVAKITYREIRELATIGASVFHEDAIAPVRKVGIPINVKNTNDPSAPGTMITSSRDSKKDHLVGVSGKKPYRRLVVEKFMLDRYPDAAKAIHGIIEQEKLVCDVVVDAFDTIVMYLATDMDDAGADELVKKITETVDVDICDMSEPLVLIGVVGEGMDLEPTLMERIATTISTLGFPLTVVSASLPIKRLFAVPIDAYAPVLNAIVDTIVSD
jgi:aspartate kinase